MYQAGKATSSSSQIGRLLATKFRCPTPAATIVARPHLIRRLDKSLRPGLRLTLVSALAGFGKTTLLSAWLRQIDRASGWLSLDDSDNDLTRFLNYLTAAPAQSISGLAAPVVGRTPASFEALLVPLINQLAGLDAPLVLVLDDYHLIADDAIHRALTFLIDHMPETLHLVVASRADPPLPLPRWRARRQLIEIRANDLRFTQAETAEFLENTLNLTLSEPDLDLLDARAEGWIAALQPAALSMQGRQDVSAFVEALRGSHRYVLDYLVEEVLQQQTPQIRAFLLRSAVLDRLSGDLCDALLEHQERPAQETLVALERSNLFLVPLDDERRWYRYHRLFHDFLHARLESEEPDLVPVLHRRAARWYAEAGATDEAVHHALAGEDHDLASALVADAYRTMLQRGRGPLAARSVLHPATACPGSAGQYSGGQSDESRANAHPDSHSLLSSSSPASLG